MPRSARKIADEGIYHLLNRGNGQQQVFQKDGDYQAFLQLFAQAQQEFYLDLFAYCLMPNHSFTGQGPKERRSESRHAMVHDHTRQTLSSTLPQQWSPVAGTLQEFCY